ncbi:trypsin-like serine peptidase [Holophaga foetida]|uniref:trypsin-like serine peptidase n=1 Tax=Holophaga foetida TaxID=35839 RepID=UPI000247173B|nr:serine protease [Holophaga foetida]
MPIETYRVVSPSIYYIEDCSGNDAGVIGSRIIGTGFLIDPSKGFIATAAHVVDGVPMIELQTRRTYNREGDHALGPLMKVSSVFMHPYYDIAIIEVHHNHTKQSLALNLGSEGCYVGSKVVIPGYAHGTDLVWVDDILGEGCPKSVTPIQTHANISAIIPDDSLRPAHAYAYDGATYPGQSGSPVILCGSKSVIAIHTNGYEGSMGYGVSIVFLQDLLARIENNEISARDEKCCRSILDIQIETPLLVKRPSEKDLKINGSMWRIIINDADPLPSNPHAHLLGTRKKLHLKTGDLYIKSQIVGQLSKRDLKRIQDDAKKHGIALPI